MSYDVSIVDSKGDTIHFPEPHQVAGGTYAVGGTSEAYFNITYNYAPAFYRVLGDNGLRSLDGQLVATTLGRIEAAMKELKDDVSNNYWDATEGNAKRALAGLLVLGYKAPEGKWKIE